MLTFSPLPAPFPLAGRTAAKTHLTVCNGAPDLFERYISTPLATSPKHAVPGRAGAFALGNVAAAARLSDLSPDHSLAQQLNFIDPDIIAEPITFASP